MIAQVPESSAKKPRVELASLRATKRTWQQQREITASYDAAQDTDDLESYWANADSYDSDSANSQAVRKKLVDRSRYEIANNGYADGMIQTHANYLVGKGPQLRMQTQSKPFNEMVETRWKQWMQAAKFRRKLWCQAHAKLQDGEGFGIAETNQTIRHPVKIGYRLFETEQCQTPDPPFGRPDRVDGIHLDEFGEPEFYDILTEHPGSESATGGRVAHNRG